MKFEQLLQLYWTKGYLFGGQLHSFHAPTPHTFRQWSGLGSTFFTHVAKRFELGLINYNRQFNFTTLIKKERQIINMFLARLLTSNYSYSSWQRYHILRLYSTRTYAGRCHMLGKPVHGQRTWSNAWTAYTYNTTLRLFIAANRPKTATVIKKKFFHIIKKKRKKVKRAQPSQQILWKKNIFLKKKQIKFWF